MQQSQGGVYDIDPALTEYVQEIGIKLADAIEEIAGLATEHGELELFLESLRSSERGLVR